MTVGSVSMVVFVTTELLFCFQQYDLESFSLDPKDNCLQDQQNVVLVYQLVKDTTCKTKLFKGLCKSGNLKGFNKRIVVHVMLLKERIHNLGIYI